MKMGVMVMRHAGLALTLACVGLGVMLVMCAWLTTRIAADGGYPEQRLAMVRDQIEARGVRDRRVLDAMRKVPRHEFVLPSWRHLAYADMALPIDCGQTISQPYVVALMTDQAEVAPGAKVLEVGTGSGYQAALLAQMGASVYSIEIDGELARQAAARLQRLGYASIRLREGDGYRGWPEHAPFQAIVVTAAPDHVPQPLVDQLAVGGKMVIPVGSGVQQLLVLTRTPTGKESRSVTLVRFVPMRGEAEKRTPGP